MLARCRDKVGKHRCGSMARHLAHKPDAGATRGNESFPHPNSVPPSILYAKKMDRGRKEKGGEKKEMKETKEKKENRGWVASLRDSRSVGTDESRTSYQ